MKKFLSMLLALSVVFTYTFGAAGSVFAGTYDNTDKYLEAVNTAEKAALDYEAAQYAVAVAQANTEKTVAVTYDTEKTITVDTAIYLTQLEAVYTAIKEDIKAQTKTLMSATGTDNGDKIDYADPTYTKSDAAAMLAAAKETKYAVAAIAAQLDAEKADAVKNIGTVDTTIYSTTKLAEAAALTFTNVEEKTVKCYSAKDYADALKADYVARINAIVYDKDVDTLATVGAKVADLIAYVATVVEDTNKDGIYTMKATIKKAADEAAEKAEEAAKIAAAKSSIQSKIATEYAVAINKANYTQAEWDKLVAAYTEVEEYLVQTAPYTANAFPTAYAFNKDAKTGVVTLAETSTGYVNAAANVALYKAAVAEVKAEKNTDGSAKYDAESVDAAVKALVEAAYNGARTGVVTAKTAAEAVAAVKSGSTEETYVTEMNKAMAIKAATDAYEDAEYDATDRANTYYPAEYAAAKVALDAYIAAVNVAVIADDMTKAADKLTAVLADIKFASQITYTDTAKDKAATALANAKATAKAYVDTLNVGKDAADRISYDGNAVEEFLKYNGARDAAGIVALYDALKADIAKTETTNQAKKAAKAVQAKIDALPATLTLTSASEASVLEVKAAYDELSIAAKALVNAGNLTLAVNKVKALVDADITAAAKAINKDCDATAVKVEDKAAVKALAEKCDAYKENYNASASKAAFAPAALRTIKGLESKAVIDAIKNLPVNVTKEDKAAVEAARAAYDAYVAEYTDLSVGKDAAAQLKAAGVNLEKLQAAEATIAELTKYTVKDAKLNLYEASKATSYTKPTKNSVALTVKADLTEAKENGYTVKYSFYQKGPKKTSYKLWKTTTSGNYTFKGLKKGTHYFKVKISVYDAEGNLVASKYTNYRYLKIK